MAKHPAEAPHDGGSSARKVFDVDELLEWILHQFETKDLLFAQRVCRSWKTVIERSPKLQRALFLRPVDLEDLMLESGEKEDGTDIYWWSTQDYERYRVFQNPLLLEVKAAMQCPTGPTIDLLRAPYHRPNATWRKMLMTQPAIHVSCLHFVQWLGNGIGVINWDNKEVRMGEILEEMSGWVKHYPLHRSVVVLKNTEAWEELVCNAQIEKPEKIGEGPWPQEDSVRTRAQ